MNQDYYPNIKIAIAPAYSAAEEFTNALTHGIGFLISVAALIYMIAIMPAHYSPLQKTGAVAYGISLMLMFLTSTLYHAATKPKVKDVLKRLDHSAIYLLIAGTYTPLLTISLNSVTATVLLIIIWSAALIGVIFKAFFAGRFKWFSVSTYLAMGWAAVFVIYELFLVMAPPGFLLLLIGGAAYSIGVIFYVTKAIAFNHAIWHCFVLIGALSHCWLILEYVLDGSKI
ncbi:hemolysin III family protein [Porticoccaceae bacterium]|nr:hemolysin III family protein [Porticoccaceae bacterium]